MYGNGVGITIMTKTIIECSKEERGTPFRVMRSYPTGPDGHLLTAPMIKGFAFSERSDVCYKRVHHNSHCRKDQLEEPTIKVLEGLLGSMCGRDPLNMRLD